MNSRQLLDDAIRGNSPTRMPVWFMRQAGRLFGVYRELREEYSFKELCRSPELNARVTCLPVEELEVDAGIIFSDILLPLESIGAGFEIVPGEGPVLDRTIETPADVKELQLQTPREDLNYVFEAITRSLSRLPGDVPVIGFAGAPFTLASYLVEGGRSRSLLKTRKFMVEQPRAWADLMDLLVEVTVPFLNGQVEAGAEFLQVFDSWVGQLSPGLYQRYVLPYTRRIFDRTDGVPIIHFGTGTAGLLDLISRVEPEVVSLDWRIDLADARDWVRTPTCFQGNLDPGLLLGPFESFRPEVDRILEQAPDRGHVFNLGHGFLPETEPETVKTLVDYVKTQTTA